MFPTADEEVLANNPQFDALYRKLTSTVLNPDGSTKGDGEANRRAAVRQELDVYRFKAAKHHILSKAIASATPQDPKSSKSTTNPRQSLSSISEPLLDLLLFLPTLLDAERSLSSETIQLLFSSAPFSDIEDLLPEIASITSSALRSSALNLSRITHPTTNPSYLHRHISTLSQDFSALLSTRTEAHARLLARRLHALTSLTELMDTYTQVLAHLIRTLESKHGVTSRYLELRAQETTLQLQHSEQDVEQTRLDLHREIYTPETANALSNYMAHLRDAKVRTTERIKGLEAELSEFGVGVDENKEAMMKTLAREYGRLARERSEVRGDLDRLRTVESKEVG